MPKRKDLLLFALKFILSFTIIAYLLAKKVPLKEIGTSLRGVNIFWLILSFSLHSLGLLISARRWQILIEAQGDKVPLGFLAKSYLVGNFFNLFLPTRFGGDLVRIWDGSRYSKSLLKSSATVLVERLTGVIILLLFAFSASLYRLDVIQRIPVVATSLVVSILGLLAIIVFFSPLAQRLIEKIPEAGHLKKIKQKILEFRQVVWLYAQKRQPFYLALFWAFLLQVNVILHYFLVGKAFQFKIPLLDYFIFMPVVLLILTIPVTISGLGLREVLYIEIFKFYSTSDALAVSFSLIGDIAFALIIGLIGGVIYGLRK